MNKPLFFEALNYIDPETISEHISKKQDRESRRSTPSISKGISGFIKRPIGIIAAILLILALVGSVIAISVVIKSKNKYQVAHDRGIPIEEVDTEGNLKHTPITDQGVTDDTGGKADDSNGGCLGETFDDPKTDIYCKMLNTIDRIDLLELKMKTDMVGGGETTVVYKIDIDGGRSNEICYEDGKIVSETFCKNGYVVYVHHRTKTYCDNYLPVLSRNDSPYVPLKDRITTNPDNGTPVYYRRMNITNCPSASYCIVPQDFAFSYLKDFEKWEITGEKEYLGRKCVLIEGTTNPYNNEKTGGDSFKMTVDSETGVLLEFEIYKDAGILNYMYVTECAFDVDPEIKEFNPDDYSDYTKVDR